jgi:glycosyltransferase involved in cell wall biosynthesis
MTRVLHVARCNVGPTERRIPAMVGQPGFVFRLVRPPHRLGPVDSDLIGNRTSLEGVSRIGVWRIGDPHRGLYQTLGFGIRQASPDIIHAEEEPDALAALQLAAARRLLAPRARLVLNTWQNVNRRKRPAVEWVLRRSLAAADAIVCGNEGAVALLREMGYRRPAPVIPALSLDPTVYFRRPVARFSPGFTVGCTARLVPEKGVDTLIRAVAALGPPVTLVVAGTGPLRRSLEELARSLGIGESVVFIGWQDTRGVADYLSAIDALVVPSRPSPVWQEQFGRVIVEAMGCEVPVVASASGAIPEVLGGAGLLFPTDDAEALSAHLRDLRASPARRNEIGRRGREWALSAHSPILRATRTLEFYTTLVGGPSGVAP